MSRSVIVSGYATLDYTARLPMPMYGASTATVVALTDKGWPRPGGAPLYATSRLAAAGHLAQACVAVGEDANAEIYLRACSEAGIDVARVRRDVHVRTPWCMLLYHDDGQYTCLIDRGEVDAMPVNGAELDATASDLLCIAAGSSRVSAALLSSVSDHALVAWIAKCDRISFPDWLLSRLAQRSDVIFCNASERPMIDAARRTGHRAGQTIVETRGATGVIAQRGAAVFEMACEALDVNDTTGAGDTFAGEVLAQLLLEQELESAVKSGAAAARALLLTRLPQPGKASISASLSSPLL